MSSDSKITKICAACGGKNAVQSKFCIYCGTSFMQAQPAAGSAPAEHMSSPGVVAPQRGRKAEDPGGESADPVPAAPVGTSSVVSSQRKQNGANTGRRPAVDPVIPAPAGRKPVADPGIPAPAGRKPVADPVMPDPADIPDVTPPIPDVVDDDEYTDILDEIMLTDECEPYDEDSDETTILVPEPVIVGILVRLEDDVETEIHNVPYVIGRKKKNVDFFIPDNTAVSRKHAEITKEGDLWYISDLGSKNGTSVNDEQLPAHEYRQLNEGDVIVIADTKFEFAIRMLETF